MRIEITIGQIEYSEKEFVVNTRISDIHDRFDIVTTEEFQWILPGCLDNLDVEKVWNSVWDLAVSLKDKAT